MFAQLKACVLRDTDQLILRLVMPPQSDLGSGPDNPAPTGDATPAADGQYRIPRRYARGAEQFLPTRCDCPELGWPTEAAALAAAANTSTALFPAYLCGSSSRWHHTGPGFTPGRLVAYARKIAYLVAESGVIDRAELAQTLIRPGSAGSARNFRGSLETLLAERVVAATDGGGRLVAVDAGALIRIAQASLEGWRTEQRGA